MLAIERALLFARRASRGDLNDPVTTPIPRIIVGDGARLTPAFVAQWKITHVINCAEDEMCPLKPAQDKYVCINALDSPYASIFQWYPAFKEAMDNFLRDPTCENVYIHCQCGINRSVFLTLAYLADAYRIPVVPCALHMIRQRPCIMTNRSYLKQVMSFAKKRE